jgi:2,3-dihydroxy-p-cumate/2,3-dihydroxybenzoate 3,4-dioxygenase
MQNSLPMPPAPFRYRKLGYAALNVADVKRTAAFYRDIVGLDRTEIGAKGEIYLRCGPDHHNIVLHQAPAPGLKRVGFELENADELERARVHLGKLALAPEPVPADERQALHQGDGLRFREPLSGLVFEYYTQMSQMAAPCSKAVTKIVRLGHVVLGVAQFDSLVRFLTHDLGFRVSDYVQGRFAFLRCFPNPLHHSFALGKSKKGNHLHHVNFMVTDIDDIGIALNRLKRNGVEIVFGPGRHQPSGSIFLYFLDPDGMTVELSYGMEEFPERAARDPRMIEPTPEALDMWGGLPSPNFGKVGAI